MMDCSRFSEILADFEEGKLSPGERRAAEAHVEMCSACRRLRDVARGGIDLLPEDRADELARSILDHTSGTVCLRVESGLWDFAGGELGKDDSQLVEFHLRHCSSCRSVAGELSVLREELPAMAEIEPGGSFTREVVSLTSRISGRPGFRRLQAWWNALIRRPLFSYEAAYVGTLLLILVFSPFLPFRELAIEKAPSTVIQPAANRLLSFWVDTEAPISDRLYKIASAADWSEMPIAESLSRLVKTCETASASMLNRSVHSVSAFSRELIRNSKFEIE